MSGSLLLLALLLEELFCVARFFFLFRLQREIQLVCS
jgi:hypothetical protein